MKNTTALLTFFSLLLSANLSAQNNVGIGTSAPNPNAILEMQATDKGVLVPRMTTVQRNAIASPTEGLMVYDITADCFFFYESTAAIWKNLCSSATGTPGPAGPAGPQGIAGTNGASGATGATGPAGPAGAQGPQGVAGPTGPAGSAGIAGAAGATGPQGAQGLQGDPGPAGPMGAAGATGPAAPAGAQGIQGDPGPAGPMGATGAAGPNGTAGANGTNGTNGTNGAAGATGATGPQGPSGVVNRYHVYGTAGRANVTSTAATVQPGMSQTFTLTAPATVVVWATIGALNVNTTTGQYSNLDMIVYLNGAFLANGGWNRFSVVNGTAQNAFNTCAINTMVSLPAGTYTIDLRTARVSGTTAVNIGGNAAIDTNPGEMTIMILN